MERISKFRAWDVEKKKMGKGMPITMMAGFMWAKYALGLQLDNFIWLEFTSLKDENGKEIYEGDIVKTWIEGNEKEKFIEPVVWEMGCWMVSDGTGYFTHLNANPCEIVGNIFTHPQMLK